MATIKILLLLSVVMFMSCRATNIPFYKDIGNTYTLFEKTEEECLGNWLNYPAIIEYHGSNGSGMIMGKSGYRADEHRYYTLDKDLDHGRYRICEDDKPDGSCDDKYVVEIKEYETTGFKTDYLITDERTGCTVVYNENNIEDW